ncbi:MAG: hypothetical protein PUE91_01500 [Clostridiales bacterium]|nr:hypothetical protein [Clostridiales bacterium]
MWRPILIVILVILLVPSVILMRQVEELKRLGKNKEAAEKQKKLDWLSRALIVLFLGVLAVTMYNIYFAG